MRRLLFLAVLAFVVLPPVALAALAVVDRAAAATANVAITKAGFIPSTVTINVGDTVTWTNADTADHQLISDKAGLASPVLKSGQSYSFTFRTAGQFPYQDALERKFKGTVKVAAVPPPPRSVTIAASKTKVIFGGTLTLSGTVSSHQAGENVTIHAQRFGEDSSALATATTSEGGAWSYVARPPIQTSYQARWKSAESATATIGVRPRIAFRVLTRQRFFTKAVAARSFAGRSLLLQRRSALGQWISIKRVVLSSTSSAVFRARLPRGTSSLRVFMSVNQAGPGYLAGISRTIVYHRV
jgi:plastocyanin